MHAQGLVVVAAQVLLKRHVLEQFHPLAQGNFLICLPEKSRIVEAGPQHAFVAVTNYALGVAIGIQHREKVGGQFAARILHRKILLVIAHDRNQHFFR